MGRGKKADALKDLQGTKRADRTMVGIELDKLMKVPSAPKTLSVLGKKKFRAICRMLLDKQLLYSWDVQMIIMLAEEMATYDEACNKLNSEDENLVVKVGENGYQQQSPWLGIRNKALANIKDLSARFGFDPLSREKFGGAAKGKEDTNPFDNL